jgi:hypothetical protein
VPPAPAAANDDLPYTKNENDIQLLRDELKALNVELKKIQADNSAKDIEIEQLQQIDEDAIQKKEELITQIEDYEKSNSKLIQRNGWLEKQLLETTKTTINEPITEWQQAALLKQRQQIKFVCGLLQLIRYSMQEPLETKQFVEDCQNQIQSFETLNTAIDQKPTTFSYTDLHQEQRQWIYKAESFLASCYASIPESQLSKWYWLELYFQTIAGQDKKLQTQKNAEVREYKQEQVKKQKDFMKHHPMKPYEPY